MSERERESETEFCVREREGERERRIVQIGPNVSFCVIVKEVKDPK